MARGSRSLAQRQWLPVIFQYSLAAGPGARRARIRAWIRLQLPRFRRGREPALASRELAVRAAFLYHVESVI